MDNFVKLKVFSLDSIKIKEHLQLAHYDTNTINFLTLLPHVKDKDYKTQLVSLYGEENET